MQIADRSGYALKKKRKKTYKIGLHYLQDDIYEANDPYYHKLRIHTSEAVQANQLNCTVFFGSKQKALASGGFDGLIIVGTDQLWCSAYDRILERLAIPAVLVDFKLLNTQYDYVIPDLRDGMQLGLNYVLSLGYERIGYIGKAETSYATQVAWIGNRRREAYVSMLTKRGLYHEELVFLGSETPENSNLKLGYSLAEQAINAPIIPDVLLVENDSMAIGVMNCLHQNNFSIPGDMGVMGFNDDATSAFMNPPLTTVKIFNELSGEIAVRALIDRMQSERDFGVGMIVPSQLIVRDSLRKP